MDIRRAHGFLGGGTRIGDLRGRHRVWLPSGDRVAGRRGNHRRVRHASFLSRRPGHSGADGLFPGSGVPSDASNGDAFDDDEGSVHEAAINRLAASEITQGCTETLYCPNDPVTRAQMASFLDRALGLPRHPATASKTTRARSTRHSINRLASAGITEGLHAHFVLPQRPRHPCPDGCLPLSGRGGVVEGLEIVPANVAKTRGCRGHHHRYAEMASGPGIAAAT